MKEPTDQPSPPRETESRKTLRLPDSVWQAIADYRFRERISSEAEATRRLLAAGLKAVSN